MKLGPQDGSLHSFLQKGPGVHRGSEEDIPVLRTVSACSGRGREGRGGTVP